LKGKQISEALLSFCGQISHAEHKKANVVADKKEQQKSLFL